MISVGTNNIKTNSSDPETMVKLIYNYVKSVTRKYPLIHVFLPGVLPVHCAYQGRAQGGDAGGRRPLFKMLTYNFC